MQLFAPMCLAGSHSHVPDYIMHLSTELCSIQGNRESAEAAGDQLSSIHGRCCLD